MSPMEDGIVTAYSSAYNSHVSKVSGKCSLSWQGVSLQTLSRWGSSFSNDVVVLCHSFVRNQDLKWTFECSISVFPFRNPGWLVTPQKLLPRLLRLFQDFVLLWGHLEASGPGKRVLSSWGFWFNSPKPASCLILLSSINWHCSSLVFPVPSTANCGSNLNECLPFFTLSRRLSCQAGLGGKEGGSCYASAVVTCCEWGAKHLQL